MPSATLWLLDGNLVHEAALLSFARRLSATELRRYAVFARRSRQRQFLLGRMLLRAAVAGLMDLPLDAVGVVERPTNAPRLVLSGRQGSPGFSLSHRRNWIACVVSADAALGLDIEVQEPIRDINGISELAFHPSDHHWLLRQPEVRRLPAFYDLWCSREALYKLMSGTGQETRLPPLADGDDTIASQGSGWYRYSLPRSGLTIVICSERPLFALRTVELNGFAGRNWLAAGQELPAAKPRT
jgi:4'-phosphopantetheinyl transferase